jgi:hypothetical protein
LFLYNGPLLQPADHSGMGSQAYAGGLMFLRTGLQFANWKYHEPQRRKAITGN